MKHHESTRSTLLTIQNSGFWYLKTRFFGGDFTFVFHGVPQAKGISLQNFQLAFRRVPFLRVFKKNRQPIPKPHWGNYLGCSVKTPWNQDESQKKLGPPAPPKKKKLSKGRLRGSKKKNAGPVSKLVSTL